MWALINKFNHSRLTEWIKRIASFSYKELFIQAMAFSCGLLILRHLPKSDYALYTLIASVQASTAILADSGLSNGIIAIGGAIAGDRSKLGELCQTASSIRLKLTFWVCIVMTPLLAWLLYHQQASIINIIMLCTIMAAGAYAQIGQSFYSQFARLTLRVDTLQRFNIRAAVTRLLLVSAGVVTTPMVSAISSINTITMAWQLWRLNKWRHNILDENSSSNEKYKISLMYFIRRQAPLSVYYCFYGQISIFLLGIFGTTESIADIGALGRFSLFYSLLSSVMNNLIYPRFARVNDPKNLPLKYAQSVAFFLLLGSILPLFSVAFPNFLLMILGGNYYHLENELTLVLISSLLSNLSGVLWALNSARGWTMPAILSISYSFIVQIFLIYALDISSLHGVILLSLFTAMASIFVSVGIALIYFKRPFSV
jgi:O-antigen/teichoic acid export membrane protein